MKNRCLFLCASCFLISLVFLVANHAQYPQWKGTIEEINGITVIKNPNEPLYGEITFELEEDLSIGNEEDENYSFYKGLKFCVRPSGEIFILNQGESRVQVYNPEGKFLFSFGRKGQGPGELMYPSSLEFDDEWNIYVKQLGRMSIFNNQGKFIRSFSLDKYLGTWGVTETKSIIGVYKNFQSANPVFDLLLIGKNGQFVQSVVEFPFYSLHVENNYTIGAFNVFNYYLEYLQLVPEVGVYGYSEQYRLCIIDSKGNILFVIEKKEAPQPITKDEKRKAIDIEVAQLSKVYKKKIPKEEVEKKYRFPRHKPFFHKLLSDGLDNIYVAKIDYKKKLYYYDLFNKEGIYLYKIFLSKKVIPMLIRHWSIYEIKVDSDSGYYKIERYKIKNWDKIKK